MRSLKQAGRKPSLTSCAAGWPPYESLTPKSPEGYHLYELMLFLRGRVSLYSNKKSCGTATPGPYSNRQRDKSVGGCGGGLRWSVLSVVRLRRMLSKEIMSCNAVNEEGARRCDKFHVKKGGMDILRFCPTGSFTFMSVEIQCALTAERGAQSQFNRFQPSQFRLCYANRAICDRRQAFFSNQRHLPYAAYS